MANPGIYLKGRLLSGLMKAEFLEFLVQK